MQDRVPQARVYLVWNTPEGISPDSLRPGARRPGALVRQVEPSLQAAGVRRPDRHRRHGHAGARGDRRPVPDPGHRAPRRRPPRSRDGDPRGAHPLPREGTDPGRARPGAHRDAGRLHPRRGAHRRVRREVGHPGPERDLRRPSRLLRGTAGAHPQRHPGAGAGCRAELALRRRLRPRGHPLEGRQGARASTSTAPRFPTPGRPPPRSSPRWRRRSWATGCASWSSPAPRCRW